MIYLEGKIYCYSDNKIVVYDGKNEEYNITITEYKKIIENYKRNQINNLKHSIIKNEFYYTLIEKLKHENNCFYNPNEINNQNFFHIIGLYNNKWKDTDKAEKLITIFKIFSQLNNKFEISALTLKRNQEKKFLKDSIALKIYPQPQDIIVAYSFDAGTGVNTNVLYNPFLDINFYVMKKIYPKYISENLRNAIASDKKYHNEIILRLSFAPRNFEFYTINDKNQKLVNKLNLELEKQFGKLNKKIINYNSNCNIKKLFKKLSIHYLCNGFYEYIFLDNYIYFLDNHEFEAFSKKIIDELNKRINYINNTPQTKLKTDLDYYLLRNTFSYHKLDYCALNRLIEVAPQLNKYRYEQIIRILKWNSIKKKKEAQRKIKTTLKKILINFSSDLQIYFKKIEKKFNEINKKYGKLNNSIEAFTKSFEIIDILEYLK